MSDNIVSRMRAVVGPLIPQSVLRRRWVAEQFDHGEPELHVAKQLLHRTGPLVDIGANSGIYSVLAVQCGRTSIAFEPVDAEAVRLRKLLGNKGVVHQVALSDSSGVAVLHVPFMNDADVTTRSSLHDDMDSTLDHRKIKVDLCTLDSFELQEIAVLKIDVEGHEAAVLRGALDTLTRLRPPLIIEVEEDRLPGAFAAVRDFMERLGYTGYWLDPTTPRFVADFDLSINQVAADRPRWGEPKLDRYINNFVWLPDFGVAQQLGWPTATGELG